MSEELKPTDLGFKEVTINKMKKPRLCRCGDTYSMYRWSPLFCPDCDLKRMRRIDDGMKEIARGMGK